MRGEGEGEGEIQEDFLGFWHLCALHNWTAQRCSQSYTETRRRRKETEVARRIKGGTEKEGDRSSQ